MTITFPAMVGDGGNELTHRVRNLGEALYAHFSASGGGLIDLTQVDKATTTLVVRDVRQRDLGRMVQAIRELAATHFPERDPEITKGKVAD